MASRRGNRWIASRHRRGKCLYLGTFRTELEATRVEDSFDERDPPAHQNRLRNRRAMNYEPCTFTYPTGQECILYRGHPDNKSPTGPHVPSKPIPAEKPQPVRDPFGMMGGHS